MTEDEALRKAGRLQKKIAELQAESDKLLAPFIEKAKHGTWESQDRLLASLPPGSQKSDFRVWISTNR